MPAPPPPPPMAPAAPPQPVFNLSSKGDANERGALLKSIRQGAKLKKTVTVDKSAPLIPGKVTNNTGSSNRNGIKPVEASPSPGGPPANGLGGLFAGGMPKLKPTGKLGTTNSSVKSINNNEDVTPPAVTPTKSFSNIQIELKKQLASDNRNRGPPPPAPNRTMSRELNSQRQPFGVKDNVGNGLNLSQLSLNANVSSLHANNSTLHRKAKSNANLSLLDRNEDVNNSVTSPRPVISHGKPNLAPKPPTLNGKPAAPQKRNSKPVSRAHSMRSPRSPSPQSPDSNPPNKFGTVRHMSSIISQSLSNSTVHNQRLRPALSSRPSAPPPSVPSPQTSSPASLLSPSQPTPPQIAAKPSTVRHPNQAPPPPPLSTLPSLPQPPNHAPPPPPPHKTQPIRQPPLQVPSNNGNPPPPPPPRHSSMRDTPATKRGLDLDDKFKNCFQSAEKFPQPLPYKNILKIYSYGKPGS